MILCAVPVRCTSVLYQCAIFGDLPPYTSDVEAMRSLPLTLFVKPIIGNIGTSTDLACQTDNVIKTYTYTHDTTSQIQTSFFNQYYFCLIKHPQPSNCNYASYHN